MCISYIATLNLTFQGHFVIVQSLLPCDLTVKITFRSIVRDLVIGL